MGRDSGTRLYSCPVPDSACGSRQDTLLPAPDTQPQGRGSSSGTLRAAMSPASVGSLPCPPTERQEHPRAPALTPSPAAFSLTGSPSCMRHPDAVGMGTAAHTLHTAGTFPAALPGRAGEEEMGMGWQVHTSSALSQLSPAPSHPAHHMPAHTHPPPPPAPAPGTRPNPQQKGWKKKSSK